MALVSGPTVGTAIADAENDLARLVAQLSDNRALAEELFLKILNRPPSDAEFAAFEQMLAAIDDDHQRLAEALAAREAWWKKELPKLQADREAALAEARDALAQRRAEIAPERERLAAEREERIAAARKHLETVRGNLLERRLPALEQQYRDGPEWMPLRPSQLAASNGAELRSLEDRSILAEGSKEKGTYEVTIETQLDSIRGLRLEALPMEDLEGGGPGFPPNGNFVLTELEVFAQPLSGEAQPQSVKIAKGQASFTQAGFNIAQTFDGKSKDQRGWAVSPAGGVHQWATFQLAQPVGFEGGVRLTIKLHQYHNAADHRLAHFRLSATQHAGEVGLSVPEAFATALAVPAEKRGDDVLEPLLAHLRTSDPATKDAERKLAEARKALPADPGVSRLERQIAELEKPIPIDGKLVQLRSDFEQSQKQLENSRLTAAEDLTWALINSPAFLFNH
jgi:hypothetical protein